MLYRRIGDIWEGDLGLPIPIPRERRVKKLNKKRVEDVQKIIKSKEPVDDFTVKRQEDSAFGRRRSMDSREN